MVSEKFLEPFFPFWEETPPADRRILAANASEKSYPKGKIVYLPALGQSCLGLMLVKQGGFRAYIVSEGGREVTLYRIGSGDVCFFSASCIMKNIAFDLLLEAEEDARVFLLPSGILERVMGRSVVVSNFINSLMAERFSRVMRTLEHSLFKSMDSRIAEFLLKEERDGIVKTTHAEIAKNLGSVREVITRILGFFEEKGIIERSRGRIVIKKKSALESLRSDSVI